MNDFTAGVLILVNDGMAPEVADALIRLELRRNGTRDPVVYAEHLVGLRAQYRRRLEQEKAGAS